MFEILTTRLQQLGKILKKFLLRIFVFLLVAILFTSWLMVGLKQLHFIYAIWISVSVVACWVVVMILITLKERKFIEDTGNDKKSFAPKEIGILEIISKEDDQEFSVNA